VEVLAIYIVLRYISTMQGTRSPRPISESDYATLADFRFAVRQFLHFSEERAAEAGLSPQQHQALLAMRAAEGHMTVGELAERLLLKPHSASGLIDRLHVLGLAERRDSTDDRRRTLIHLTSKAKRLLERLTEAHRDELVRMRPLLGGLLDRLA
jgi:DNA-binding MarR family transcriptional regulator